MLATGNAHVVTIRRMRQCFLLHTVEVIVYYVVVVEVEVVVVVIVVVSGCDSASYCTPLR